MLLYTEKPHYNRIRIKYLQNQHGNCIYKTKRTQVKVVVFEEERFILKEYTKKYVISSDVLKEVAIHSQLHHINIIKLHAAWETKYAFFLLLEYAENKDLFDFITSDGYKFNGIFFCDHILHPLCCAITHLHEYDIAHTDIKPENIAFTSDGTLKLLDFGLAVRTYKDPYSFTFTHDYAAPELLDGSNEVDEKKLDIWCIGVLASEMFYRDKANANRIVGDTSKHLARFIG